LNDENRKVGRPKGSYKIRNDGISTINFKTTTQRREKLKYFSKLNNVSQSKYAADALDAAFSLETIKLNKKKGV
jgi:hypothetical protein